MNNIEREKIGNAAPVSGPADNKISELLWNFGGWLSKEDEYSDIIISSRIRLARNIKGYPFPHKAETAELHKLTSKVKEACLKCKSLDRANYIEFKKLKFWDSKYFVERRLASPQFIENKFPSLLVIGRQESLSIMVNEEDHLRIQCIVPGLGISEAWKKISRIDDELENNLTFSFSDKLGYLTACPTNIGTGMRVSVFAHLPALSLRDEIEDVLESLPVSEIAVRGFYGEGSESIGDIFQVSNQITLGRAEQNIIKRIVSVAKELVERERDARIKHLDENRVQLEDTIFRALGILQNARIITSLEAMNYLSTIRLGIELGIVENISRLAVNQLMVLVQPAHLQNIYDKELGPDDRDIIRAEFLRENLTDID